MMVINWQLVAPVEGSGANPSLTCAWQKRNLLCTIGL